MTSVNFLYPNGAIKAATFTFDDGINFDKKFINILNGCGMKGTFCVNSGEFDENICWPTRDGKDMIKKINTDEVAAAYEGHEVCIHGYNHIYWTNHPREQMFEAIYHDKCTLEELVGYPIRGIAYPFSSVDEHTVNIAKLLGLRYGRIAGEEPFFQLPEDMYSWAPTSSHWAPKLMDRAKHFLNENFNTQ
ncbi:MAG: polysaccharide deacetylase family protein [Oscillospiraceae bacterium]